MPGRLPPDRSPDDERLAELGARLAREVEEALPTWVCHSVVRLLDAWLEAGGHLAPAAGTRADVVRRAEVAGRRAATEVSAELGRLLSADVDGQWTTPLTLVRRAVAFPTAVLAGAGVAPLARDRFAEERFPHDPYDLTPASLAALAPELAELAVSWGAAKATAHRVRHGP